MMRDLRQIEVLTQKGSACGTTSLAMIMRFLLPGSAITPEGIDSEIRRLSWMFSSPHDLMTYARRNGLQAKQYNNNQLRQLEELVSRSIPVMALLDLTPNNALDVSQWHWVVVVGVEGAEGQKTVLINNPWGRREEWRQDDFSTEWAHLRLLGLVFGYSNYMIALGTTEDVLPETRAGGVGAANTVTKGLADVLNGYACLRQDGRLAGAGQTLAGVGTLVWGGVRLIGYNLCYVIGLVPRLKSHTKELNL